MIIAINASRARSGGAVAHLVGILGCVDPMEFGISEIHVWGYAGLLDRLAERPWLIKHSPKELNSGLPSQMWWERFRLPGEARRFSCSILLNVDAGSVCRFSPAITMSRDMLSYEPGEIQRYGFGAQRLRLIALRYVQNAALRHADGAVFLTRYAAEMIQQSCGKLRNVAYIPHGVGADFLNNRHSVAWPDGDQRPVRCLYISNALPYKHQWHVIDAIGRLRAKGFDLLLELVGGGEGAAQARLEDQINETDPELAFVRQHDFVPQSALPEFIAGADLFVFASSCENMPNTLLEAMAAGLPIACSDRGPMSEVLEDGGVYFDPEDPESIAAAVSELIQDETLRARVAVRSRELAQKYSWDRCARETFRFVAQTADQVKKQAV